MGRAAIISRDEALRRAMELFWSRGYSATTIDDIQTAVGLKRGSIYSYFDSKKALFDEALGLYQKDIVEKRRQQVLAAPTAKKGIELFFSLLIDHSIKNRKNPGCLNTNTAAELSVIDKQINEKVNLSLKSWELFWIKFLEGAQAKGEFSPTKDVRALARLLITLTQGINVVSKVKADKNYLNSIVSSALVLLDE